jgi:hypothetical protein
MLRFARGHEPKEKEKKRKKRKKKAVYMWAQQGMQGGTE